MPLTFAHPAAILPFSRKSNYIYFFAMVLGSMAPDFEYFLRGQPLGEVGHTFTGFVFLNLPLVIIIYFLYHTFVHQTFENHLPVFLQDTFTNPLHGHKGWKVVVFCYSALFGMLTHVVWDSFTHINGFMVRNFPMFTQSYSLYGFDIPFYKFLQHGSTLLGITCIIVYMIYRALRYKKQNNSTIYAKEKLIFGSVLFLLTVVNVWLWYLLSYVSISNYGVMVVRIIDSFFVSLFTISLLVSYRQQQFTSQ